MKKGDFVRLAPTGNKIQPRDGQAKYVNLENVEAGKVVEVGEKITKVAVSIKEEGKRVIEIIEVLNEWIPRIIEPASEFFEDLQAMFSRLPEVIKEEGKSYNLTLQPARTAASDYVMYMHLDEDSKAHFLFINSASSMFAAKRALRRKLKELNYI